MPQYDDKDEIIVGRVFARTSRSAIEIETVLSGYLNTINRNSEKK